MELVTLKPETQKLLNWITYFNFNAFDLKQLEKYLQGDRENLERSKAVYPIYILDGMDPGTQEVVKDELLQQMEGITPFISPASPEYIHEA